MAYIVPVLIAAASIVYVAYSQCPADRECPFTLDPNSDCSATATGSVCQADATTVLGGCCSLCSASRACPTSLGPDQCPTTEGAGSTCVADAATPGFGCCSLVTTTTASTTTCVDKLNPLTGVSDCPSRAYLCNDSTYLAVMTDQCPRTCGRCSNTTSTNSTSCVDLTNPSTGVSDCPARRALCNNSAYTALMRVQCPATCGFCTSG